MMPESSKLQRQIAPIKDAGLARKLGHGSDKLVKPLVVGGSVVTLGGLAGYGLVSLLREVFIVSLGISAVDMLSAVSLFGAIPLGALLLAGAGGRSVYSRVKRSSQQAALDVLSNVKLSASNITPATIRTALEDSAAHEAWAIPYVDDSLTQLDEMDANRKHLQRLIRLNEVNYLDNVVASLDEVEQYLCMNFLSVINRFVVGHDNDRPACEARFKEVLADNRRQLDNCQKLLDDTADWVSGNLSKSSLEGVKALQEVIHEQVAQLQASL